MSDRTYARILIKSEASSSASYSLFHKCVPRNTFSLPRHSRYFGIMNKKHARHSCLLRVVYELYNVLIDQTVCLRFIVINLDLNKQNLSRKSGSRQIRLFILKSLPLPGQPYIHFKVKMQKKA